MKRFFGNKSANLKDTRKYTTRIVLIFVGLFIIILVLIGNISKMNGTLQKSAEQYVMDAMEQLTADVTFRFRMSAMYVEQLANSIERMPSHIITAGFLENKADSMKFESILLIDKEGNRIPENFSCEDLDRWLEDSGKLYQGNQIAHIEEDKILFSTPVRKSGEEEKLLVGVYEDQKIQDLLQLAGFDGKGASCIADKSGEVIVAPSDSKPLKKIQKIIKESSGKQGLSSPQEELDYRVVNRMIQDIQSGKSGVIYINSMQGTPLMISYRMLGVNDWMLFSMIPQNLLIAESETYMQWTSVIIVSISVIMVFLFVYVLLNYRKSQNYLEKIAFTDPLTGGKNNAAFQIQCREIMEENPQAGCAIVFLNIRGFKHINENFGVEEGNKTLRYIYNVLLEHIGEKEVVTRSESDFFLFLQEKEEERVSERLEEISKEIRAFEGGDKTHYSLNISQGAYIIDDWNLDIRIIQDRARGAAGYQAESDQCVFYDSNLAEKVNKEIKLNSLFEESIENRDFKVYLQPKVSLKENKICGAEALVRWIHPEYGVIYPSEFIPLFEKNGKICRLDIYMFEEICKLLCQWMEEGRKLIPISVNLSRRNIGNWNFFREYVEIKEKYQIPDYLIEFELTESMFFDTQQIQLVKHLMQEMHTHGFLCSLDDFGFGYSSLALLKEVDIDTIKLDRQFFLGDSDKMWKVVAKLISLAKELGIRVVAEGIELLDQVVCLQKRDCDMVQGYVYSKPLVVSDFLEWSDTYEGSKEI